MNLGQVTFCDHGRTDSLPPVPELAKTYDPAGTEARWQQAWENQGAA